MRSAGMIGVITSSRCRGPSSPSGRGEVSMLVGEGSASAPLEDVTTSPSPDVRRAARLAACLDAVLRALPLERTPLSRVGELGAPSLICENCDDLRRCEEGDVVVEAAMGRRSTLLPSVGTRGTSELDEMDPKAGRCGWRRLLSPTALTSGASSTSFDGRPKAPAVTVPGVAEAVRGAVVPFSPRRARPGAGAVSPAARKLGNLGKTPSVCNAA